MTATTTVNRTPGSPRPGAPGVRRPAPPTSRSANAATIDPIRVVRQHIWALVLSLVAGIILGGVAHFVWAFTYPIHRANTLWTINLPKDDTSSVTDTSSMSGDQMDRIINTAAERLLFPGALQQAINSPEIRGTKWIKSFTDASGNTQIDDAMDDLTDHLSASSYRDSLLVRVSATGPDKDDLVAILTAVNNEYQRWLNQEREKRRLDIMTPFTTERNNVQASIKSLLDEINLRIETDKINPDVPNSDQAMELGLIRETIAEMQSQFSLMRSVIVASEQRLTEPSLVFDDSERVAARQDPNVARLESEVVLLRTSLREARDGFGTNHPHVMRLENRLDAAKAEFDDELQQVLERNFHAQLEGLKNQARGVQQSLVDLEAQRQEAEARLNDLIKDVEWVNSKRAEVEALQARSEVLDAAVTNAQVVSAMEQTKQATLAESPKAEPQPTMPKLVIMLPLGVIVSVGLTAGVVFLREFTDQRIKGPSDVAMLPRGVVLGVVPHIEEDPTGPKKIEEIEQTAPNSVIAESIRQVHVPLARKIDQEGARSVLFIPGQPGAGASAVLSNLAVVFARAGRSVLLIDADLRRPHQASIFGLHEAPGLGDALGGDAVLSDAIQSTNEPNLSVLSAGADRSRQTTRLSTPEMPSLVAEAQTQYDLVLIDCPAAVAASDWEVLANIVDANVLVVRALQEERGLVSRLIGKLHESRSIHLGVIINGMRSSVGGYLRQNLKHMEQYQTRA